MGKGDRRTRRGKISRGTHGVRHLRKEKAANEPTSAGKLKAPQPK